MNETIQPVPGLPCVAAFLALRIDASSATLTDEDDELLRRIHQVLRRVAETNGELKIPVNQRAKILWNGKSHPICVSSLGLGEIEVTCAVQLHAFDRLRVVIPGPSTGVRYRFCGFVAEVREDGHCARIRLEEWMGSDA